MSSCAGCIARLPCSLSAAFRNQILLHALKTRVHTLSAVSLSVHVENTDSQKGDVSEADIPSVILLWALLQHTAQISMGCGYEQTRRGF